ncbi:hypothetical protein NECAME_07309 [Necator americanus]|uniref:Uncharacterized protein n=1 Tax=Necator americanus TaxID=51031 RepID=W2TR93_NECAM|nr:hypothetical protein NECAME_07309 [Necator americanus]ETN83651.1 hypothetical protein NECAME_07309 [Necator americanus]
MNVFLSLLSLIPLITRISSSECMVQASLICCFCRIGQL